MQPAVPTHEKYRPEIDGLRALAVIPVILFHAGFSLFSGGFIGVDIFFVISGYLITQIIAAEIKSNSFTFARFYERRARRILPALFLVLSTCTLISWFWLLPRDMKSFSESLMSVLGFLSNVYFKKTTSYFDEASELKPLLHTWSLAVEEQYYLLFPFVLIFAMRKGMGRVLLSIGVLFIASLALSQWWVIHKPTSAFYLLWSRFWELLVGAAIALYLHQGPKKQFKSSISESGATLGLGLVLYAIFAFTKDTPFPGYWALIPVLGAGLIITFAHPQTHVGQLLARPSWVAMGLISYSAYLWHQPLFAFARHRADANPSIMLYMALILISFALAYLSWRFVETPFRKPLHFSRQKIVRYFSALFVLLFIFGWLGKKSNGFSDRANLLETHSGSTGHWDFYYDLSQFPMCTPEALAANSLYYEDLARCRQSKANTAPQIALIGDSHAEHLFPGLAKALPQHNVAVYLNKTFPFLGEEDFAAIHQHLLDSTDIKTVIIAVQWFRRVEQTKRPTPLHQELEKTILPLLAAGKQVFLAGDVPIFHFSPERCKYQRQWLGGQICGINKEEINTAQEHYMPELRQLLSTLPSVQFIDLKDLFCTEQTCSMVKENRLMYRDENHLNTQGSEHVGKLLISKYNTLK